MRSGRYTTAGRRSRGTPRSPWIHGFAHQSSESVHVDTFQDPLRPFEVPGRSGMSSFGPWIARAVRGSRHGRRREVAASPEAPGSVGLNERVSNVRKSSLAVAASLLIVVSSANAGSLPTNLVGMTATSYTMSGSSTGRSQLSFQSSSNGSFNPSYAYGQGTGDFVAKTDDPVSNWNLGAYAADYGAIYSYPGPLNVVGVEANATGTDAFDGPSVLSCTYMLVFSADQTFAGVQNVNDFNSITATLTLSGGATTDLTNPAAVGTVFTAGTYTLVLQGNDYGETNSVTLAALFAPQASAVPGTGIAALLGATIVARRRRR